MRPRMAANMRLREEDHWIPCPADGADYTAWADHYEMTGVNWGEGDFTGDQVVDGADYTVWADNYEAVGSPVPKPATSAFLAVFGVAFLCRVRASRRGGGSPGRP